MFKKLFVGILLGLSLVGCAGQSAQVTTGKTLLAMHDLGKTSAETANTLCVTGVIKHDDCMAIKDSYELFKRSWPIVDDALIVYLKSSKDDVTAAQTFEMANQAFVANYVELINILAKVGILKESQ